MNMLVKWVLKTLYKQGHTHVSGGRLKAGGGGTDLGSAETGTIGGGITGGCGGATVVGGGSLKSWSILAILGSICLSSVLKSTSWSKYF